MRMATAIGFVTIFVILSSRIAASAQSSLSMGVELKSRYVWRGLDLGGRLPVIQPSLEYSYTSKNEKHCLSVGAWGAYTFSQDAAEEVDLIVAYTFNDMLTVSVSDYFFPGLNAGERDQYFNYDPDSTGHVFEASVSFSGNNHVPVTALFAMNVYGNDSRKFQSDSTLGPIVLSKYLEVGFIYSFSHFDLNAFVGAALDNPDKRISPTGYYENPRAGIVNVGINATHSFRLNDHLSLPIRTEFIVNPMLQKVYLVFGISLCFTS